MHQRDYAGLRFVECLFRNRWIFLISVVIVSGITMAAIVMSSHSWQAGALTQIVTEDVAAQLGVQNQNGYDSPAQQNVKNFYALIRDNLPGGFLDTALKNANLAVDINPRSGDPRYRMLIKNLSAAPQTDTLFAINLTWDNPVECEKIVRALQDQYIEEVGLDRSAQSIATSGFLDSQIKDYESRMRKAEQLLIDFKRENFGHLPEEQSAEIAQLTSLQAQRDNLMITRKDAQLKMQALQERLTQVPQYSILEQNITQSPLMAELMRLKTQRSSMVARLKPNHPNVIAIDEQIANLQKDISEKTRQHAPEASNIVGTKRQENPFYITLQQQLVEARITDTTQQAQLAELDNKIIDYQKRINKMPLQQRELTDKTRDYSILKERYETLLKKREEIQMQGALDKVSASSTLKRIGLIYAEPTLSRSKKAIMFLGSIVLGLIVGILVLVLNEWADRSLRYPADARRLLGVPVLAVLDENKSLKYIGDNDTVGSPRLQSRESPPMLE